MPRKKVEVPAYAQGEHHARTAAMLQQAKEVYGRPATPEEIVAIKQGIHDDRDFELPPPIPSKEEKAETRLKELREQYTRADLEALARELGFEATNKAEFPNIESIARAIVAKEAASE